MGEDERTLTLHGIRVAVLVENDFEDIEFSEPVKHLREGGAEVVIVGTGTSDSYKGKHGAEVTVDADAESVNPEDFDAVVIPGGYAPDKIRMSQPAVDFVKLADRHGKLIAAICHGPQVLISADIVRGRTVTSWHSIAVDLKNAGAIWVDRPVVIDGNLITSRKPEDLEFFSSAIIKLLVGKIEARKGVPLGAVGV